MSITTRRGDDGRTDMLFGRRIEKDDPRMEAIGAVDELNAVLGVARAGGPEPTAREVVDHLQGLLVGLMGELAVHPDDTERYRNAGFPSITEDDVEWATRESAAIEAAGVSFDGWARPGESGSLVSAHFDLARVVCRRAERRVLAIEAGLENPGIVRFLNRCSDLLWLLARKTEGE